jgi:hypothetical protein
MDRVLPAFVYFGAAQRFRVSFNAVLLRAITIPR